MFLNRVTRDKDQKLLNLLTFLGNNMTIDQLTKMQKEVAPDWGIDKSDLINQEIESPLKRMKR